MLPPHDKTELVQTCLARPPRAGSMEASCNVTGCEQPSWAVIEQMMKRWF